jgi:hypothetical protein
VDGFFVPIQCTVFDNFIISTTDFTIKFILRMFVMSAACTFLNVQEDYLLYKKIIFFHSLDYGNKFLLLLETSRFTYGGHVKAYS